MMPTKTRVPALEGWFTLDEHAPALLGSRCQACGNTAFPAETFFCRNPHCTGNEFDSIPLSRRGTIWSYTDAGYQPPAPYVAADPYVPFCIAAVELTEEKMVVLGQVISGVRVEELSIGTPVELVLEPLYEDDDNEYLVWKWRPTSQQGVGAVAQSSTDISTDAEGTANA